MFNEDLIYWRKLRKASDSFEDQAEEREFQDFHEVRDDRETGDENEEENVHILTHNIKIYTFLI